MQRLCAMGKQIRLQRNGEIVRMGSGCRRARASSGWDSPTEMSEGRNVRDDLPADCGSAGILGANRRTREVGVSTRGTWPVVIRLAYNTCCIQSPVRMQLHTYLSW